MILSRPQSDKSFAGQMLNIRANIRGDLNTFNYIIIRKRLLFSGLCLKRRSAVVLYISRRMDNVKF